MNTIHKIFVIILIAISNVRSENNAMVSEQPGYIQRFATSLKNRYNTGIENTLNKRAAREARTWKKSINALAKEKKIGDLSEQERAYLKIILTTLSNGLQNEETSQESFAFIHEGPSFICSEFQKIIKLPNWQNLLQVLDYTCDNLPPVNYHYSPDLNKLLKQRYFEIDTDTTIPQEEKDALLEQVRIDHRQAMLQGFKLPNIKEWTDNVSRLFKHYADIVDSEVNTDNAVNKAMLKDFRSYVQRAQQVKSHDYVTQQYLENIKPIIEILQKADVYDSITSAYQILGASPDEPVNDVFRKGRALVIECHPDRHTKDQESYFTQQTQRFNGAWKIVDTLHINNISIPSIKTDCDIVKNAVNQLQNHLDTTNKMYMEEKKILYRNTVLNSPFKHKGIYYPAPILRLYPLASKRERLALKYYPHILTDSSQAEIKRIMKKSPEIQELIHQNLLPEPVKREQESNHSANTIDKTKEID